jgi:magnesium transporter
MLRHFPCAPGGPDSDAGGWIDLFEPGSEERSQLQRDYHISIPSREALQEIEASSRLRVEGQVLYLSMPLGIRDEAHGLAPVPLGFILTPSLLVSLRYRALRAFDTVAAQLQDRPATGSAAVFSALVDAMVDNSADMLEQLASDLAMVSLHTFGDAGQVAALMGERTPPKRIAGAASSRRGVISRELRESLRAVGAAGDLLSSTRESLLGLQRITRYVEDMGAWIPEEVKARLASARADLNSLVDFESHLSGKTQFLLDAVLGFINTEQNDIFKVLTIVSVVGIPPTLIASMYGMNFHGMPELSWRWGYPYGLTLIALSIVLPIVWFKRRGWW